MGAGDGLRVVVSNLAWSTTDQQLHEFLSQSPGFLGAMIKTGPDGRSKGIGFATFGTQKEAAQAIKSLNGRSVNGREVSVAGVNSGPRGSYNGVAPSTDALEQVAKTGALYVSNLTPNTTLDMLRDHFGAEGALEDAVLLMDKATGMSKQSGFITFTDHAIAKTMLTKPQVLDGNTLRVLPRSSDSNARPDNNNNNNNNNSGQLPRNDNAAVLVRSDRPFDEKTLRQAFSSSGQILKARIFPAREGDRGANGLVQFASENSARSAQAKWNGKDLVPGVKLTVRIASEKPPRDGPPPGGRGNGKGPREGRERRDRKGQQDPTRTPRHFQSRHEIDTLHFFGVYVAGLKGNDNWVKMDKHMKNSKTRMNKQAQMVGEAPNLNLSTLMHYLHLGGQFIGPTRAQLLLHWYTLLQAAEKPGGYEFKTPNETYIDFRQAFILSNCIENMVIASLDYPFSTPIPDGSLPATCRLTVPMIVSRIFLKTLVGGAELHDTLLASIDKLAQLPHVLTATLKNNVGRLVACFKSDAAQSQSADPVDGDVALEKRRLVRQELGLNHPPSIEDLAPPGTPDHMAAADGFAPHGGVRAVFDGLSSEIGEIAKLSVEALTKYKNVLDRCDAEAASIEAIIANDEASLVSQLETLQAEEAVVHARKMEVKNNTKTVLDELGQVEQNQQALVEQREGAVAKIGPLIENYQARCATVQSNAHAAEDSKVAVHQVSKLVGRAQTFLMSTVKESRANDLGVVGGELSAMTVGTVDAVQKRLLSLMDDVRKKKKKSQFCMGKLESMRAELAEMQELGFYDVADDLDRGVIKLTQESQAINDDCAIKGAEADELMGWLQSLQQIGLIAPGATQKLDMHFAELKALQRL